MKQKLENISFDIQVVDNKTIAQINKKAEIGCYIYGIYLEGGRWDQENHYLVEPHPLELFFMMPPLHFRTITHKLNSLNMYECPLYKTVLRFGILDSTGRSTNFIMTLAFSIFPQDSPVNWKKAGLAAFLSLKF